MNSPMTYSKKQVKRIEEQRKVSNDVAVGYNKNPFLSSLRAQTKDRASFYSTFGCWIVLLVLFLAEANP